MLPLKLYILRAVHDWAVDQGFTPHVLVDATLPGVRVPPGYVENGRIVLNIHPRSVDRFELVDDWLRFSARFGAQSFFLEIPSAAVLAIYARENGQGISFPEATAETPEKPGTDDKPPSGSPPAKGPSLRIVK
jgi:stringent starvation protein B